MFYSAQLSTYQPEKYHHSVVQYWVVAISRSTVPGDCRGGGGGTKRPSVGTSIDLLGEERAHKFFDNYI